MIDTTVLCGAIRSPGGINEKTLTLARTSVLFIPIISKVCLLEFQRNALEGVGGQTVVNRELTINDSFEPCITKPNDEVLGGFPFAWNISELEKWISTHRDEVIFSAVKVSPTSPYMGTLNANHIATVDLSKPVIAVRIRPDIYRPIDGHHPS